MEMGNQGRLPAGEEGIRQAKAAFDREAGMRFAEAHALIRAKFASPEKLPFFFEKRARAVTLALQASARLIMRPAEQQAMGVLNPAPSAERNCLVEHTLSTRDGLIKGRIDLWERASATVTDYKSGYAPKNTTLGITADEIRQLRLYVHLAHENGYPTSTATIVRGDGCKTSIAVSVTEAEHEGQEARKSLAQFNQAVAGGQSFFDLASPSPASCLGCPCIALCDPFWEAAQPEWEATCGTNVEGEIAESRYASFAGAPLRTLMLKNCRGSAPLGDFVVEQIPLPWLSLGSAIPDIGHIIRVVTAVRINTSPECRVIQVDRAKSTTIWDLRCATQV
jgi:hypothetical protein